MTSVTIAGIGGCTALLMTGFGLKDSITAIIDKQFSGIWNYDLQTVLHVKKQSDRIQMDDLITQQSNIEEAMYAYQTPVDAGTAQGKAVHEAYLFVPEQLDSLAQMISLRTRIGGEPITLKPGGVVVTEKLSELLDIRVGDTLTITDADQQRASVPVHAITENYPFHFIYMTAQDYADVFGQQKQPNIMLATLQQHTQADRDALAGELLSMDQVMSVSFTADMMQNFSDMSRSLDSIVWVLIISAAALAFVVTFILTSINISERQRELATLKVLGFTDGEVASSVYRENFLLTIIGIAVGLVGGIFLHRFVMGTAEMDMLMFGRDMRITSYIYAALLTALFSGMVNLVTQRTLKRIDMVESLKSVE